MFKTILVPIDGSDHAEKAVSVAADLAGKYGATLHIITVMESTELAPGLHRFAEAEHITGAEAQVATYISDRFVERACEVADEAGAKSVETAVVMGDIQDKILEYAEKVGADLIVMGSRGLSDFKGLMLGSVSHKIANSAPCTVVTVR
ncbi:MAG: universal stress protein [Alphaproteobacteria bacterium]|jgi:nucleotide-binding universal stress UspA family protein